MSVAGARPGTHWDAMLTETLSYSGTSGTEYRSIHIGDSFADVPRTQPFYSKIETALHYGITSGCTTTNYCPGDAVSRSQMAIFLAKGIAQRADNIPASGTLLGSPYDCGSLGASLFVDVPGERSGLPAGSLHRFSGRHARLRGGDVLQGPVHHSRRHGLVHRQGDRRAARGRSDPRHLHRSEDGPVLLLHRRLARSPLHRRAGLERLLQAHPLSLGAGIVGGCSATTFCPSQTVTRDAMAKFIANGFGLSLYGP